MKHNQKQSPTSSISRQYSLHDQQRGVATVLLVILLGFTVMVMTATLARTVNSKKEATVAAHAQTNAQMMAWAGVSAFRQYLIDQGQLGPTAIKALNSTTVILKLSSNQEILAKNIVVTGLCSANNDECKVSADIAASNTTAQAATTINVAYAMKVVNGAVSMSSTKSTFNLGGKTTFSANTMISAETEGTELTLNTTGTLKLLVGAQFKNIKTLTINSTGDNIEIDCGLSGQCGNTVININTTGKVLVSGGTNNFGVINAGGDVALNAGAEAQSITTNGDVHMTTSSVTGNIQSQGHVWLTDTKVGGDVKAYDHLILDTNSQIKGNAYVNGYNKLAFNNVVRLSTSNIVGSVYADGDIYPMGLTERVGNAYITGRVVDFAVQGTRKEKLTLSSTDLKDKIPFTVNVPNIPAPNSLSTPVDVTKYKSEANYIFTQKNMVNRVFLNKLRLKKSDGKTITYYYNGSQQTAVNENNASISLDSNVMSNGFGLGFYKIGSTTYRGAICAVVDNATHLCTSEIIGYLPRISVDLNTANRFWLAAENNASDGTTNGSTNYGATDDYAYVYDLVNPGLSRWRIRTLSNQASFTNAGLAPGILYFEGNVELAGGDLAPNSVLINSLLAEGSITAIAFSPVVYSPYNAVRNGGTAALVCDRTLNTVNGTALNISSTTPNTLSNKYLMPTNLCRDETAFAYKMDKKADGITQETVTINNQTVNKLDLGKVALMANVNIDIGSCANIYGDILARGHINVSTTGSCGTGSSMNRIVGQITAQSANTNGDLQNDFTAGTQFIVPAAYSGSSSTTSTTTGSGLIIDPTTFKTTWTQVK